MTFHFELNLFMKKILSLLIRAAIIGGCLYYVFHDMDLAQFWAVIKHYGAFGMVVGIVASMLEYIPPVWRLMFLTGRQAGFVTCYKAQMLCLGLNNILPAKIGELAKALFLSQKTQLSFGQGLGLIFWERFFDLNMLLGIGVVSVAFLGKLSVIAPLAGVVLTMWAMVAVFRLWPRSAELTSRLIPIERVRLFFLEIVNQLQLAARPRFFLDLSLISALVWAGYVLFTYFVFVWVAGLELSLAQTVTALAVSALGLAVPSTPGGLGVYEAAMVFALSWYGVGKEEALAVAVAMRLIMYLPTVSLGLAVMATSGFSLKQLRAEGEKTL